MIDDGQQDTGGAIRNATALFPILYGAQLETEAVRELPAAQPKAFAKSEGPPGGRVVDDPAWKIGLPVHMGENIVQSRLDLAVNLLRSIVICLSPRGRLTATPARSTCCSGASHLESLDCDLIGAAPGLPQIVGHLHAEPSLRARPERLGQTNRHFD